MGIFHFKKKKNKEDIQYENLYEKVKLSEEQQEELELDVDLIEQTYKEEYAQNSNKTPESFIESYCNELYTASQRVEDAKKEYGIVGNYINDILSIEQAPEPFKSDINYYAKRIVLLREDKKSLKQYSGKMPEAKYNYIGQHEEEMPSILKEMYDNEQYCQSLKTDIHHIQGEIVALKYEQKQAIRRLGSIRKYLVMAGVLFAVSIVLFFILQSAFLLDMLIPSLCLMVLGVSMAAATLVYYQKQQNNLKMAELKLNKAITLMNKHKLLYANTKSILDYSYMKNDVKSSYALNDLWRMYINIKKEREAIKAASDELYKAMENLTIVLDKLQLYDCAIWTGQVEALIDAREMTEVRHTLNVRRQKLRESIDYNTKIMEKNQEKIKACVKENPAVAKEVLSIMEKYD
ncbi:MAG: hypothetical protein GX225_02145 [Clostridiales bacterium]|nr:hypothetical protein [Clostridiales bacterium]